MKPISLYNKRDTLAEKYNQININTLPTFLPQNVNKNFRVMRSPTDHTYYNQTVFSRTADRFKTTDHYEALGAVQNQLNIIKQQASKLNSPLANQRQINANSLCKNRSESSLIKPQCMNQSYTHQYGLKIVNTQIDNNFLAWNKEKPTKFILKQNKTPVDERNEKDRSIKNIRNIRNQIVNCRTPNQKSQYEYYSSAQNGFFKDLVRQQNNDANQLNERLNELICENKTLKGKLQTQISSHTQDKIRLQQYENKVQILQNTCKKYQNNQDKLKSSLQSKNLKLKQQVKILQQKVEIKDQQILELQRKIKQLNNQLKNQTIFYIYTLNNKQSQRKTLQQSLLSKQIAIDQQRSTFQLQSKIEQLTERVRMQKIHFQYEIQQINKKSKNQALEFQSKVQQLKQRLKSQNQQSEYRVQRLKQEISSRLLQLGKTQQELRQKQEKIQSQIKQLGKSHQRQTSLLSRLEQMTVKANQLQDQLKLKSPILYKNCSQSPVQSTQDEQIGILNQKIKKLESEAKADKKIIKSLKKQVELMRSDLNFLQEIKHTVSQFHFLNEELNQNLVIAHMSRLNLKYKRESEEGQN